jgi:hypothetical protein
LKEQKKITKKRSEKNIQKKEENCCAKAGKKLFFSPSFSHLIPISQVF